MHQEGGLANSMCAHYYLGCFSYFHLICHAGWQVHLPSNKHSAQLSSADFIQEEERLKSLSGSDVKILSLQTLLHASNDACASNSWNALTDDANW